MIAADGLPDDRIVCEECRHCTRRDAFCAKYRMTTIEGQPLRCIGFDPRPGAADQRTGPERWPTMRQDIEDARKLEQGTRP